jgi:hypothetical protein
MRLRFWHLSIALCAAACLVSCAYPDRELAAGSPSDKQAANLMASAGADRDGQSTAAAQPFGADERPLVTIRSIDATVDYERPLSQAVEAALERKPSATFLVQGAVPSAASAIGRTQNTAASRRGVETVYRSLQKLGLPADRISLAMTTLPMLDDPEIRVYVH